jgi:hypothetical protein
MRMTEDTIFLLTDDGDELQPVPNVAYKTEDVLQRLIAKHPDLIVGEKIDAEAPPRWLMVAREAGIPDSENGSSRWSVDHLLLDQYGRPTFVEAKRSSNTQIRREIVGQILDYAANAIVYWPGDRIRALATEQFGGTEKLDEHIGSFSAVGGDESDLADVVERYWDTVEANLRQGNVRLLFAADSIPRELRRIIEFLNEKMSTVEVLGVEIRQYRGRGISALVPRIVGQTETARDNKSTSTSAAKPRLTKEEFLSAQQGDVHNFWKALIEKAEQSSEWSINWGRALSIRFWSPAFQGFRSIIYSNALDGRPHFYVSREYLNMDYPSEAEQLKKDLEALGFESGGIWSAKMEFTDHESIKKAEMGFAKIREHLEKIQQDDAQALGGQEDQSGAL